MMLKVVAFPQDANPYQENLYSSMRGRGASVRYAGRLTASHTVNLLLLPLELACLRVRGYRVFHLHWTFGFAFPSPVARRLSRSWFLMVLRIIGLLRMTLVWTAHNVLPHEPVFDDDISARRSLVRACDLVIVHSSATLDGLDEIGATPAEAVVIPHGPSVIPGVDQVPELRRSDPLSVLFFGNVAPYKGVEELLEALRTVQAPMRVIIAGRCRDPVLRRSLVERSAALGGMVSLRLEYLDDAELLRLLADADVLVYPFRRITTSGSVMLGLAAGRPVVVPDLPAFRDLPAEAIYRYTPGPVGLRQALRESADESAAGLREKGQAARELARSQSWAAIARTTVAAMERSLSVGRCGP
jgi:glycosyltransferase involved in cell wall biosynthesis